MRQAIVSGGGTGIGRAIARRFVLAGDEVTILGRREETLAATAAELNGQAGALVVRYVAADLSAPDGVERAVHQLPDDRSVDVVVNNAGGVGSAERAGVAGVRDDWSEEFRRNVLTAVLLTSALEPKLRRPGAAIVNISSIAATAGGGDSYSGAKAAILGWTIDLAVRLGAVGIRANAVVPGYVQETEFFADRMTPERHERLVARTLLGRAGVPADIAAAVFFLASDDASYITGQFLHVNGGATLGR